MSKIVSANRGLQAPRLKKTTVFGSRIGANVHSFRTRATAEGPPPIVPPADTTFYAPLNESAGLTDYVNGAPVTFTRNSIGWYINSSGQWQARGANQPRYQDSGVLIEPETINYCSNHNAAAGTTLAGVNGNGATVSAVSVPSEIAAAGLSNIVPDGNVIEIDNQTAGPVTATIDRSPYPGGSYVVTSWLNTFGNTIGFGVPGVKGTFTTNSLDYVEVRGSPLDTAQLFEIDLGAGERCQFILNSFADGLCRTSPIVVAGASAIRAADRLSWDVSANPAYNQPEGMAAYYFTNTFPEPSTPYGSTARNNILMLEDVATSRAFLGLRSGSGTTYYGYTWDQFSELQYLTGEHPLINKLAKIALRWGPSDNRKQGTQTKNDDTWFTTPTSTYTGYTSSNIVLIGRNIIFSQVVSEVRIWNVDKGIAWLQANV